eukprot:15348975-Ditylum_brightwellii.AAC.2
MEKYLGVYCWRKKKASALLTISYIYHFVDMIYYMGVVNLLSKDAHHFHIYEEEENKVEEEEGGDKENISKEEDMADKLYLEHVVHD